MPRKASKTEKPALQFVERPVGGARLQNGPEVRAALNPRDFFTETQAAQHSSSWVSPQFDASSLADVPPARRGRRKCASTTSILDRSTTLSKKTSVCKFPSLSFQTRSREQSRQPSRTCAKKASAARADSNQTHASSSCRTKKAISQYAETPKRKSDSIGRRNEERLSSRRCFEQPNIASLPEERLRPESSNANISSVGPPPDVDTPKLTQGHSTSSCSPSENWLLAVPHTPPCQEAPDILAADTPERDYGLKVTWRTRRSVMLLFKERGILSESDVLVHS